MFPGQGAQRIGMGEELFAAFPELIARADEILGYSLRELCLQGPMERLSLTSFTQPALFVVNALAWLRHVEQAGLPDYLLGHSVSEYVALFGAGVVDFDTGLRLVQKRGELMARAQGGAMAAVLGLDEAQVRAVLQGQGLEGVYAANINTPRQIVISGERAAVERAEALFTAAGASYFKVLPVSGAFHTPFMADARTEFEAFLGGIEFAAPQIPVISNVTARPHQPARIRERMAEQITAPVRWAESIRYLLALGLEPSNFEEIGARGVAVVKPMVKRTQLEAGPLDPEVLAAEAAAVDASAVEAPAAEVPAATTAAADMAAAEPTAPEEPTARQAARDATGVASRAGFSAEELGSDAFREQFGLRYAYVAGAMYRGIASVELVRRLAGAGLLSFFGAAGLRAPAVEEAILAIKAGVPDDAPWGVNFIAQHNAPQREAELTDLLLRHGVRNIEASAFMEVSPALVHYRAQGLRREGARVIADHRIIAKVSRPDVAAEFLAPAPERIVSRLRESGAIGAEQAQWLSEVPMADALTVESDSGGHTDQGMPFALIPAMLRLRDHWQRRYPRFGPIHVGAGGGIGSPEAAAAVLMLGADYLVTGSINQCTVEAGTSEAVKDLLAEMNVQDTDYAPSPEMFELGSTVQVLKKGLFFPARANKLVALYRQHGSVDEIEPRLRQQIQERYLKRSFEEVFEEIRANYPEADIERAERLPKHRMALLFRRYFSYSTQWALRGELAHKVDFQVHCGPALGSANQWLAGSGMEAWRDRHADALALRLLEETAELLGSRYARMSLGVAG
ncbi:ACP S-malonyltransferase [Alkalilimnicola sp. S0819]|nr:ACP S-malonyltransferase [Alkalilimnicola sp. S0819]